MELLPGQLRHGEEARKLQKKKYRNTKAELVLLLVDDINEKGRRFWVLNFRLRDSSLPEDLFPFRRKVIRFKGASLRINSNMCSTLEIGRTSDRDF